jgi:hypothetical protein
MNLPPELRIVIYELVLLENNILLSEEFIEPYTITDNLGVLFCAKPKCKVPPLMHVCTQVCLELSTMWVGKLELPLHMSYVSEPLVWASKAGPTALSSIHGIRARVLSSLYSDRVSHFIINLSPDRLKISISSIGDANPSAGVDVSVAEFEELFKTKLTGSTFSPRDLFSFATNLISNLPDWQEADSRRIIDSCMEGETLLSTDMPHDMASLHDGVERTRFELLKIADWQVAEIEREISEFVTAVKDLTSQWY